MSDTDALAGVDIDLLMSRDPLSLTTNEIDQIIIYHQRERSRRAAGEKTVRPKIDIAEILDLKPKPAVIIPRRG